MGDRRRSTVRRAFGWRDSASHHKRRLAGSRVGHQRELLGLQGRFLGVVGRTGTELQRSSWAAPTRDQRSSNNRCGPNLITYLSNELLAAGVHSATGELDSLRRHSYLVVEVGARILHLHVILLFEVLLESVQKDVVVFLRDAGVTNKKA